MKTTVARISPARVRLSLEIPFDELEPDLRHACVSAGTADTPALTDFRGMVPSAAIDREDDEAALPREVEAGLLALISQASAANEVTPLGRAEVEVMACDDDKGLCFSAVIDARPEISLPDLSSIVVNVAAVAVNDGEVGQQLEGLREQFATIEDVNRPVRTGDVVQIDVHATVDDHAVAGASVRGALHEVGSGWLPAGMDSAIVAVDRLPTELDEHLVGRGAGESFTLRTDLIGGESEGKSAELAVTVVAVRQLRLPELDDEFATLVGKFETLDELRDDVRQRLAQTKKAERLRAVRTEALKQIADASAVPVLEGLVRDEVERRRRWMLAQFERVGTSLGEYLTTFEQTAEQLDNELREAAAQRVRGQLVLDAFAGTEGLRVSPEEVREMVEHRAQRAGLSSATYYKQLVSNGGGDSLITDVRRGKALALVLQRVTMKDASGSAMTLRDLRNGE